MAPRLYGHLSHDVPKGQNVCIAAYTGHFTASEVSKPFGRRTGTLAVAVVTTPGNKLLGTLILTEIPVRFEHTHLVLSRDVSPRALWASRRHQVIGHGVVVVVGSR